MEKSKEGENKPKKIEKKIEAPEEKKDEKKEARKRTAKEIVSSPIFISLVCLLIIAIGTLTIFSFNEPQSLSISDFSHSNTEKTHVLKVILLTSKDCPNCENDNSFLTMLAVNGINATIQPIDAGSADGNKIVTALGIKKIPIVILDGTTLDDTMAVKTTGGGYSTLQSVLDDHYVRAELVTKLKDTYIIPEISLDNRAHIEMLLDANECGSVEKPRADLFTDPYCAPCALASYNDNRYLKEFGNTIDFNYNFYPLDSRKMLYLWEQVSPFANYSICAARQGKLESFQAMTYAHYCNPDTNIGDYNSLVNCAESAGFHVPLAPSVLKDALTYANVDLAQFGTCLEQIEKDKPKMINDALNYGIDSIPKVVVNCKYITHADDMKRAICTINPDLAACRIND